MPPRPSSVQSDGSLHPAMSQSPMAQDRGCYPYNKVFRALHILSTCLLFTFFFYHCCQVLCREILRCHLMVPLSQPLLCHHVSPLVGRCTLGWVHISRTTQWVAMHSREDNMVPKVLTFKWSLLRFDRVI